MAKNKYKRWTQDEIDYLKANKGKKTYAKIAKKLGRSTGAVNMFAQELGLAKPKKKKSFDCITVDTPPKMPYKGNAIQRFFARLLGFAV